MMKSDEEALQLNAKPYGILRFAQMTNISQSKATFFEGAPE